MVTFYASEVFEDVEVRTPKHVLVRNGDSRTNMSFRVASEEPVTITFFSSPEIASAGVSPNLVNDEFDNSTPSAIVTVDCQVVSEGIPFFSTTMNSSPSFTLKPNQDLLVSIINSQQEGDFSFLLSITEVEEVDEDLGDEPGESVPESL